MIQEFSIRPKAQNKKAVYMFIAFVVAALAAVAAYIVLMQIGKYHGVVGFFAMVLVIAAIYTFTRYIAAQYSYDVVLLGGVPTFIVRHIIGKRESTMCRVAISSIVSVERQTRAERKSHKTLPDMTAYHYSPTLDPEITYLITARSRTDKAEITVEANDEFMKTLLEYAAIAKAELARAEAEEDAEYGEVSDTED